MKFEYWKSQKTGEKFWHIRDDNGEIVASSEGVRNTSDALQTIESIKKGAASADVVSIADPNAKRAPKKKPTKNRSKPSPK